MNPRRSRLAFSQTSRQAGRRTGGQASRQMGDLGDETESSFPPLLPFFFFFFFLYCSLTCLGLIYTPSRFLVLLSGGVVRHGAQIYGRYIGLHTPHRCVFFSSGFRILRLRIRVGGKFVLFSPTRLCFRGARKAQVRLALLGPTEGRRRDGKTVSSLARSVCCFLFPLGAGK